MKNSKWSLFFSFLPNSYRIVYSSQWYVKFKTKELLEPNVCHDIFNIKEKDSLRYFMQEKFPVEDQIFPKKIITRVKNKQRGLFLVSVYSSTDGCKWSWNNGKTKSRQWTRMCTSHNKMFASNLWLNFFSSWMSNMKIISLQKWRWCLSASSLTHYSFARTFYCSHIIYESFHRARFNNNKWCRPHST